MEDFILEYLNTKDLKTFEGVALIGSYARNDHHKWSDVDLVFITQEAHPHEIEIFNNNYFTLSYYQESDLLSYDKDPKKIINGLCAFKYMKVIYDPKNILGQLHQKANDFTWSSVQIEHAKHLAKKELIGYLEEVQKSIAGLKEQHTGKMLNGLFGLSHGMFNVIRLRDQIRIQSDNDFYDEVLLALDDKDPIKELAPHVFNVIPGSLEDQVDAGLEIFMHLSNSLLDFMTEEEREYVMKLVHDVIVVI